MTDIDECAIHGNKVCSNPYTECLNTVGYYQCVQVRCSNGLELLDGHCVGMLNQLFLRNHSNSIKIS